MTAPQIESAVPTTPPGESLATRVLDRLKKTPEVLRRPHSERLPLQTLSSLGLRRSEQAVKAGYVLLKPSGGSRTNPTPGIWIAGDDLPVLDALFDEMEAAAVSRLRAANTAEQARAIHQISALTKIATDELEGSIDPGFLARYMAAHRRHRDTAFALVSAAGMRWRDTEVSPQGFWAPELHQYMPLPGLRKFKGYRQVYEGDHAALTAYLDGAFSMEQARRAALLQEWSATRPPWFPQEFLEDWVLKECGKDRPSHPVLYWSEKLGENWSRVKVSKSQRAFASDFLDIGTLLWTASLPVHDTLGAARGLVSCAMREHMDTLRQEFFHKYTEDLGRALQWEKPDELQARLAQVWEQVSGCSNLTSEGLWRRADEHVKRLVLASRELWAQRQCKQSLPQAIKDFYPLARQMRRRITFFVGPTNSGKTFRALELLAKTKTGMYLAPLRLLALEVQDKLQEMGVPTSLVTGELLIPVEGARHTSATVEMLNVQEPVEVAVIDEIQMLTDPDRGQAWLQAFMGAPAEHLVLMGSPAALDLVKQLAQYTQEPLEVVQTHRLAPLEVTQHSTTLASLKPGTAVVAFSRRDVLDLAADLRRRGKTVAVIYGALSPEVRREQARLFREGHAELLVATDAIGMGLNLPLHTVVFSTLSKWDGRQERRLSHEEIRQIAGRAGRYGHAEAGYATVLNKHELKGLVTAMTAPVKPLPMKLTTGYVKAIADVVFEHTGMTSLAEQLQFFTSHIHLDPWVTSVVTEDQYRLARYLDITALNLTDKLRLLNAPAVSKSELLPEFVQMVRCLESGVSEKFAWLENVAHYESLESLESRSRALTLYGWMHYRYPEIFPRQELALQTLEVVSGRINEHLRKTAARKCRDCGTPLQFGHRFAICDGCYRSPGHGYDGW